MIDSTPSRFRISGGPLAFIALLALCVAAVVGDGQAAERPTFAALRGKYVGVGTVVITEGKKKKRTLSGKVRIEIRLSRNKQVLQVRTTGRFLSNQKEGLVTDQYRLPNRGRARYGFRDNVTDTFLRGSGTSNLRKSAASFTLRARGGGSNGSLTGSMALRGRTLRLSQSYRGTKGTVIEWDYVTARKGK